MSSWLENFAYHIDIGVGIFVLAALGALSIALITISVHAVRAAQANPVDALRSQ
jgi:putative ABC transport system permease protein